MAMAQLQTNDLPQHEQFRADFVAQYAQQAHKGQCRNQRWKKVFPMFVQVLVLLKYCKQKQKNIIKLAHIVAKTKHLVSMYNHIGLIDAVCDGGNLPNIHQSNTNSQHLFNTTIICNSMQFLKLHRCVQ